MLLQMALFHSFYDIYHVYVCVYIYYNLFIHSSIDGHLVCFHVLAVINSVGMNRVVHISFWIIVLLDTCAGVGSYGNSTFVFFLTHFLIYVFWLSHAECRIFSPTRDWTHAPCNESIVITFNGNVWKRIYIHIHMHITESLCCVLESNTTL